MGEGQVLCIGQGYPLEDQETDTLCCYYTDTHTSLVHTLYANIDDRSLLPLHHHHEHHAQTTEEKRRMIGLNTSMDAYYNIPCKCHLLFSFSYLSSPFIIRLLPICLHSDLTYSFDSTYCSLCSHSASLRQLLMPP